VERRKFRRVYYFKSLLVEKLFGIATFHAFNPLKKILEIQKIHRYIWIAFNVSFSHFVGSDGALVEEGLDWSVCSILLAGCPS